MEKQNYHCSITANISATEAFNKICQVSAWWFKDFTGKSEKQNDEFTVRFGEMHESRQKLIEVIPDKKIVWQVTESKLHWLKRDEQEWLGTKISFEISSENNTTQIKFTHIGLIPGIECYEGCIRGWDQYIKGSLFKLLTEGKGSPN